MKLTVFKIYDAEYGGTYTYQYEKNKYVADNEEDKLRRNGIAYTRDEYNSVYDFVSQMEEVNDDSFTDGEALEIVLETLKEIGE